MDWFIFCPMRGLYATFPDDSKSHIKLIQKCQELADDIIGQGFKLEHIVVIRGERKELIPPGDWRIINRKPD